MVGGFMCFAPVTAAFAPATTFAPDNALALVMTSELAVFIEDNNAWLPLCKWAPTPLQPSLWTAVWGAA
jgi:hypothetical protein